MNDESTPTSTLRLSEAEEKMRRALGLLPGGAPQPQRSHPTSPVPPAELPRGHFKRRFVSDGEVPVTVIPASNRRPNEDAERYHAERQAREQAERGLQEAQNTIRDLQTKLAHAEIAKNEVQQHFDAERQKVADLNLSLKDAEQRIQTLEAAAEQRARRAEAMRQARESAAAKAEAEAAELAATAARKQAIRAATVKPKATTRVATKKPGARAAKPEQKPVKWWLGGKQKPAGKATPARRGRAPRARPRS